MPEQPEQPKKSHAREEQHVPDADGHGHLHRHRRRGDGVAEEQEKREKRLYRDDI